MLFNSIEFLLFLPIVFGIYWILRRWLKAQNCFVVVASYLFYGWWDWRFLLLIAFTSACSYLSGIGIERSPRRAKGIMWANIILNLLILCLFKYYDFFAQSFVDAFLGGAADRLLLHLVLPVGISFYTFQALSYSIDVARGKIEATHDHVAFLAFVSFFPQLVAGPIERAASLLPQFERRRCFDYRQAADGLKQLLWGFFKKMAVADHCALYVDMVFEDPLRHNGATLLLAAVLFSIQIYCDFSGYSDIAIGCAKLFGITLKRNFNVPYFSRDIAEFWRRWHISLTTWFRDYIYIPLGGSRCSKGRVIRNTFVIFLVSGMWHGANWTFLAWGAYHALLFLPLILLGRNRRHTDVAAAGRALPSLRELGQMLLTFLLAALGWVIFRAEDIRQAAQYIGHLFGSLFEGKPLIGDVGNGWLLAVAIALLTAVEWINRREEHEFVRQPRRRWLRWGGYVAILYLIGAFMVTNEMPFIYFQF